MLSDSTFGGGGGGTSTAKISLISAMDAFGRTCHMQPLVRRVKTNFVLHVLRSKWGGVSRTRYFLRTALRHF